VLAAFGLAPRELQAFDPEHPRIDAQRALLVLAPQLEAAAPALAGRYPTEHAASTLHAGRVDETTVGALTSGARAAEAWLVAPLAPEQDVRSLAGLRAIMERLYAPDGCPWDREQTHESLRGFMIEETYEAVEAIDRGDLGGLREELGDLLLQIYFHAVIAEAHGEFALEDIVEAIARKMLRRHPHVFGDAEAGADASALWARWDEIKAEERAAAGKDGDDDSPFASLPLALPALQRAQSLQGRAERAGLAEARPEGAALPALLDAARALEGALAAERGAGLGALLWAAAGYAHAEDLDAESVLREASARFVERATAGDASSHA
jgi:tetrapyrrole methylase family protein/MazG family protein